MENFIKYTASVIALKDETGKSRDNYYADGRTDRGNSLLNLQASIEKTGSDCLFCVFDDIKETDSEDRAQVTLAGEIVKLHDRLRKIDRNIENKLNMVSECIRDTDNLLYSAALGRSQNRKGPTAFAGLLITEQKAAAMNLGGNRVYLYRGGELNPMAGDSSKMEKLLKMGIITLEQARNISPNFGTLTEARREEGSGYEIETVRTGDIFVICSGWLSNAFEDERLGEILSESNSADEITVRLMEEAMKNGCSGNVTAMVIKIEKGYEEPEEMPEKKIKRSRTREASPSAYLPVESSERGSRRTYISAAVVSILIIALLFSAYLFWSKSDDDTVEGLSPVEGTLQDGDEQNNQESDSGTQDAAEEPEGTEASENTGTLDGPDNGEKTYYTVKSGDSLSSISQKYYSDPNRYTEIMEANGLKDANSLFEGQELIIP